jgi:pilus assembly protein Flp/PilA
MKNLFKQLWADEEGQDLTEYALLLALIALGAITAMKTIATTINNVFSNAAGSLTSATGAGG